MGAFGTLEATKEPPEDVLLKHLCFPWRSFLLISGVGGFHFTSPALKYSSIHGKLHKLATLSSVLLLDYPLPTLPSPSPSFLSHTKLILIIWCKDTRSEKETKRESQFFISQIFSGITFIIYFHEIKFVLELFLFPTFSLSWLYHSTSGIILLLFKTSSDCLKKSLPPRQYCGFHDLFCLFGN